MMANGNAQFALLNQRLNVRRDDQKHDRDGRIEKWQPRRSAIRTCHEPVTANIAH